MLLSALFAVILFHENYVRAVDLNSIFGRFVCFVEEQNNCNSNFIDVYRNLSKSVTNLTDADTFMLLYTRKNPEEPEKLHECGGRLPPKSNFNSKNPVVVIFMPFIASFCNVAVYREWKTQLLLRDDLNIIVIDYGWGNQVDYYTAILNVQEIVRYQVDILLNNIEEQTGLNRITFTFIGHSLGAQLAGMVGGAALIIGIDPAGPGFDENETPIEDRLDPTDATLVVVIHCNAGDCLPNFGINYDAGHINFWVNGGSVQPSCHKYAFISLMKGDFIYGFGTLLLPPTCYHAQCAQYFKVSINPGKCQFVGVKCDNEAAFKAGKCKSCGPDGENCLMMGWDTYKNITNIPTTPQRYYVKTTLKCPYCDDSYVNLEGFSKNFTSYLG